MSAMFAFSLAAMASAARESRSTDSCQLAHELSTCSNCPSTRWRDAVAPLLLDASRGTVTLVAIGASKGYGVVDFLQRFQSGFSVSNREWGSL